MKNYIVAALLVLSSVACSQQKSGETVYSVPVNEEAAPSSPVSLVREEQEQKDQTQVPPNPKLPVPQSKFQLDVPSPANPDGTFGAYGRSNMAADPVDTTLPYKVLRFEQSFIEDSTTFGEIMNISNIVRMAKIPMPVSIDTMRSKKVILKTGIGIAFRSLKPSNRVSPTETYVNGQGRCLYYLATIKSDLEILRVGSEFFFEKKKEHLGFSEANAESDEFVMDDSRSLSEHITFCEQKYWKEVRVDLASQIAEYAVKELNKRSGICDPTVGYSDVRGDEQCMNWFLKEYPCETVKSPTGQVTCKRNALGQIVVKPNGYRPQYGSYTPMYADTIIPRCVYQEKTKFHACEARIMKGQLCHMWEHNGKAYDHYPFNGGYRDPFTPGFYGKCDKQTKCTLEGGQVNKVGPFLWGMHTARCQ